MMLDYDCFLFFFGFEPVKLIQKLPASGSERHAPVKVKLSSFLICPVIYSLVAQKREHNQPFPH